MDTFKEVVSLLGAVLSLLASLIPVLAYLADRKRREDRAASLPAAAADGCGSTGPTSAEPRAKVNPTVDPDALERARELVRRPAMVMLLVGCVGLVTNLFTAGVGCLGELVPSLGLKSDGGYGQSALVATPYMDAHVVQERAQAERSSFVLGVVAILGAALASAVSIWSAYSMLHLRNYWLAMAGTLALMPGSCLCCLTGVPVGIWSIVVLLKPEVAAAFR